MKNRMKSKKNYTKKPVKFKKVENYADKKRKNYRFIQRGKEMVETHIKQKLVEDKYKAQSRSKTYDEDLAFADLANNAEEVEESPFDELLTILDSGKNKKAVIEESEEDEESDNDEGSDMDEGDDGADEGEDAIGENESEVESDNDSEVQDDPMEEEEEENSSELEEEPEEDAGAEELAAQLFHTGEEDDTNVQQNDIFALHLDHELAPKQVENLLDTTTKRHKKQLQWPALGNIQLEIPINEETAPLKKAEQTVYASEGTEPSVKPLATTEDLEAVGIKAALTKNTTLPLTALQAELFSVLNNYQDLYYPQRNFEQAEELRAVYCLHVLNHMLKTRSRIMHHNAKIQAATKKSKSAFIVPDNYRDQGLVRPKVLIVLPMRDAAYRVINLMAQLLYGEKVEEAKKNGTIINYERFNSEYTGNTIYFPKTNRKPENYEQTFAGNTDDNFRIGISLTKKCFKLYTVFYASDILIASPLGLRTIIGAQSSAERDYDFLNSIELLIIDQAELILAQNWENLLHVLEHMHLQPQSLRDADFQRVRPWCLSGHSQFYRQTMLLTTHELPEFRALFNGKCNNYRGRCRISNPIQHGDIRNVIVSIPQQFQRIEVSNLESSFDQRFEYFIHELLPRFRQPSFAHCMIYVPSYFDYVRLRNYFKAKTVNFVQICEYTKKEKMARARDMFYHSGAHFLLYSERAHFFRRTRIKGIRHLIMYQPPQWPHFYSELVNFMHAANQNSHDGLETSMSITVLYTKYDLMPLNGILDSEAAAKLMQSGKTVHAFANE